MTLKGIKEMTKADVKRAAERIALRVETVDGKDYLVDSTGKRTPIDNIDVIEGPPGKDGHTPVKGVDYFDGQDGADGEDGSDGKDSTVPGPAGNDGIVPMYGPDGALWKGVISREYEAVTDANGRWQIDYSALGFTSVPRVHPIAWYESTNPSDQAITGGASKNKTHASGRVVRGVGGSIVGLTSTWRFVPTGTPVTITVTGPTR